MLTSASCSSTRDRRGTVAAETRPSSPPPACFVRPGDRRQHTSMDASTVPTPPPQGPTPWKQMADGSICSRRIAFVTFYFMLRRCLRAGTPLQWQQASRGASRSHPHRQDDRYLLSDMSTFVDRLLERHATHGAQCGRQRASGCESYTGRYYWQVDVQYRQEARKTVSHFVRAHQQAGGGGGAGGT